MPSGEGLPHLASPYKGEVLMAPSPWPSPDDPLHLKSNGYPEWGEGN